MATSPSDTTPPSNNTPSTNDIDLLNPSDLTTTTTNRTNDSIMYFKSEYEYLLTKLPPNYPKPAPPIGTYLVPSASSLAAIAISAPSSPANLTSTWSSRFSATPVHTTQKSDVVISTARTVSGVSLKKERMSTGEAKKSFEEMAAEVDEDGKPRYPLMQDRKYGTLGTQTDGDFGIWWEWGGGIPGFGSNAPDDEE
ncbi:hypothetical protein SBOR_9135 [Sclerotinia borealis F-4128]|uniref:Uncharacterized protein n=1 Tax=Sclerotinia borealis (strain F-4128) TaxID=1432307 RepID=W9C3M9_SCLBF|nr:hypothetical protein SBOR_9135 [Sclerotinia borealis F-4128]